MPILLFQMKKTEVDIWTEYKRDHSFQCVYDFIVQVLQLDFWFQSSLQSCFLLLRQVVYFRIYSIIIFSGIIIYQVLW